MTITPVLEAIGIIAAFELYLRKELGLLPSAVGSRHESWVTYLLDHIEEDYAFLVGDCGSPKGAIVNPMCPETLKRK